MKALRTLVAIAALWAVPSRAQTPDFSPLEQTMSAELARLEAVLTLQGDDIRSDEVDEVLVVGRLFGQEQVVLAEDAGREPTQHHPHLGAGGGPTDRGQRAGESGQHGIRLGETGRVQSFEMGPEEPLEAGDVRVHPPGTVRDPGARRTGGRAQPR